MTPSIQSTMQKETLSPLDSVQQSDLALNSRRRVWLYFLLWILSTLYLFMTSSRSVNVYDQGIGLTAAMRGAAGQVVHRDFYYNYGPAGVYMAAATLKFLGTSMLVLSLEGILQAALTALIIYILARGLSNPLTAVGAFVASLLWSNTLGLMTLFTVWPTWLLIKAFGSRQIGRRVFAAGLMAGFTTLLRYDLGVGLASTHMIILLVACMMRERSVKNGLRQSAGPILRYLAAWSLVVLPLFAIYLAIGNMHDFLYDIVRYPATYYHAARNLPFPRVHRRNFEDIIVYIFPLLIALAFHEVIRWWLAGRKQVAEKGPLPAWIGGLVSFGAISVLMYGKGLVRIGAGALFTCIGPCILLTAVLYANRRCFDLLGRLLLIPLTAILAIGGFSFTVHGISREIQVRSLMLSWFLSPQTQDPQPPFRSWCGQKNPLSKGVCYFPDNDHIQAVTYIVQHTNPSDTLYVGLPSHDRILINDNLTYFAAQRLPATKWSHFDPYLQNRDDIQREMVGELERNKPPYVVLDSEFENDYEPNGSAVHTGVHVLDDYIASRYAPVEEFGELSVLKLK